MLSATPPGQDQHPDPDSNRGPDVRTVRCFPLHHRDMEEGRRLKEEARTKSNTESRVRRCPLFRPLSFILRPSRKSRRLDSHQHGPGYETGASLFSHIGVSTSARSRTPLASVGGWLLSQEHTRVGLPAHRPGAGLVDYCSSSTFQYASLMNFDQLAMRSS